MQRDEAERIETARLCLNVAVEVMAVAQYSFRQAGLPMAHLVETLARYVEEVREMSQPEFRAAREAIARR